MKTIATSIVMLFAVSAFANPPAAPAAPAAPVAAHSDCSKLKGDAQKKCVEANKTAEAHKAAPATTTK